MLSLLCASIGFGFVVSGSWQIGLVLIVIAYVARRQSQRFIRGN